LSFNSHAFRSLRKAAFFAATFLVLLMIGMLSAGASTLNQEVWTMTPTNFTASPFPTSTVPANIFVVDNTSYDTNYRYGTSLALNPDGIPVIAYRKRFTAGLSIARCNSTLTCDAPLITTLDSDANKGIKLALDGDIPVFTFVDADNYLKVGRCADAACSSVTLTTLETAQTIGLYAIALDTDHLPVVAYSYTYTYTCGSYGCVATILKVAHCNTVACDNPTITQLDSDPYLRSVGVAVGSSGNPVVSYNIQWNSPRLAICHDPACTDKDTVVVDSVVGLYSSLRLNSSDIPMLAYAGNGGLKLATCNNTTTCDSPTFSIIPTTAGDINSVDELSLTLDDNDAPAISYYNDFMEDLKLARCADSSCTTTEDAILDSYGKVGAGNSLVVSNGRAYISYINQTTGKVMLYIENKPPPPTITPTPSLTPSQTPVTPTSPPKATPAPAFFAIRRPTMTWNRVTWAQGYQLEIDDDPTFGSPLIAEVDANRLNYQVESELADGMYYWHVRAATNVGEWGEWSATETIVVSAP
jgi:hypothetical protein